MQILKMNLMKLERLWKLATQYALTYSEEHANLSSSDKQEMRKCIGKNKRDESERTMDDYCIKSLKD